MWPSYVVEHLIPRINGFEVLMASYAMAHVKIDMLLDETGCALDAANRLRVYLTNSLEEAVAKANIPFVQLLNSEANEARLIKQVVPVMVVLGNPPYSGESQNSGKWIENLLSDYKKEPSGGKLQERNSKWINDDYVKFIRYGQYFIEQNGEGILAFINNHSFLDNPTFRGMRWSLLNTFDKIYILDLHGNSKKKEAAPGGLPDGRHGGKDENVFDIQQGVSINIFIKTHDMGSQASRLPDMGTQASRLHDMGTQASRLHDMGAQALPCPPGLATVYHADLYGKRADKYDFLLNNSLQTVKWRKLELTAPQYFFVAKDFSLQKEYDEGFSIKELFPVNSVGIVTARDGFTIHDTAQAVKNTINEFIKLDVETARNRFDLGKDARDWSVACAQKDLTPNPDFSKIVEINYRPFDKRFTYYTGNSKGFHCMPRGNVMQHFLKGENIGLVITRQTKMDFWKQVFITNAPTTALFVEIKDNSNNFPLYLYPESDKFYSGEKRKPNLSKTIVDEISRQIELPFSDESKSVFAVPIVHNVPIVPPKKFTPIDLLDYIYAVLYTPEYREKYREFLKIDFPRVPYPPNAAQFWTLADLGAKLRRLHLMEGVEPQSGMADFPAAGGNKIETLQYVGDKVYINKIQYFDQVPPEAWNFYIGGYQPAQKWLKDRKEKILGYDDIRHYQRIIRILKETGEIMRALDAM